MERRGGVVVRYSSAEFDALRLGEVTISYFVANYCKLGLSISMNNMYSYFVGLYVLANIVQRQWHPRITPDIYSLPSS